MSKPLIVDLFCGLGGWAEGFLAEGFDVIGFDIERHDYGNGSYPGQLVLQDVLTLHGSQFKDAVGIVASPPCQKFSYMAMPWSKAKALIKQYEESPERRKELTALFDACFRIQHEASAAAGRHIPLIVENVRGAQRWVGRSAWNFGSYHLWGDVPALMPITMRGTRKTPVGSWDKQRKNYNADHSWESGVKLGGGKSWSDYGKPDYVPFGFNHENEKALLAVPEGRKSHGGSWFGDYQEQKKELEKAGVKQQGSGREWFAGDGKISRLTSSKSQARKAASAEIAKIPFPLANYIAKVWAGATLDGEAE